MITVTGTYQTAAGTPAPGHVHFHPTQRPIWLPDPNGPGITAGSTITHDGRLTARLPAPGSYVVSEHDNDGHLIRRRTMHLHDGQSITEPPSAADPTPTPTEG